MGAVLLVGVDCSTCGDRALDYARSLALATQSRLMVAHVIEWSPYSFSTAAENESRHRRREEELDRARAEIIEPIVSKLREAGIDAEGVIRHGHPAKTLNQLANETGATCIIVGRTGSSRLAAQLFGSVPSSLVQISDKPVTVVP